MLEFLMNRGLSITMLSLEREAGVINGVYSDDMLFLRQLILDGQWDDVVDFVQPLSAVDTFDMRRFLYVVHRHKYLELLCVRAEAVGVVGEGTDVEEVVECLGTLERLSPSKEEYGRLCLLLTLARLSDHPEYAAWNPSAARVQCFVEVYPLVEKLLPVDRMVGAARGRADGGVARDDRMVQLLVKVINLLIFVYILLYIQYKRQSAGEVHRVQSAREAYQDHYTLHFGHKYREGVRSDAGSKI